MSAPGSTVQFSHGFIATSIKSIGLFLHVDLLEQERDSNHGPWHNPPVGHCTLLANLTTLISTELANVSDIYLVDLN